MQKIVVLLMGLALALAACAAEAEPIELTQSIDGTLFDTEVSVMYPEGWFFDVPEGENVIRIASREDALGPAAPARRTGDVSGGITLLPLDALGAYDLEADDSVTAVARALADALMENTQNTIMGSPTSFDVNDRRGAVVRGAAQGDGSEGQVAIAIIQTESAYGVVTLGTFGDNFDVVVAAQSIVETLTISE